MASLRHSEILKVVACSPKSTIDQLISVGEVLNPVDLTRLTPEVRIPVKTEPTQPILLRLWTILRVKLASIDEQWAFSVDQLQDILRIINKIIHDECGAYGRRTHLKDGTFSASSNMN